jgi:hypothetical protein
MMDREPERAGEKLCVIGIQWQIRIAKGAEEGWDRK